MRREMSLIELLRWEQRRETGGKIQGVEQQSETMRQHLYQFLVAGSEEGSYQMCVPLLLNLEFCRTLLNSRLL